MYTLQGSGYWPIAEGELRSRMQGFKRISELTKCCKDATLAFFVVRL